MGGIAVAILLLSMTDAIFGGHGNGNGNGNAYGHQQWSVHGPYNQPPSFQVPPGHGHRIHPQNNHQYYSQQQQQQQNAFIEASLRTAEWVCRNPRTGDMMIISSESSNSQTRPQQQPSYEYRQPNYSPENGGCQPSSMNEKQPLTPGHNTETSNVNPATPSSQPQQNPPQNNNNNNNPPYHAGEGMIDIRMGKN